MKELILWISLSSDHISNHFFFLNHSALPVSDVSHCHVVVKCMSWTRGLQPTRLEYLRMVLQTVEH